MKNLLEILSTIRSDIDFTQTKDLIDDGILDSFDVVMLVGEINEAFDISIGVDNLVPENFNSITAMMRLITRLQNE